MKIILGLLSLVLAASALPARWKGGYEKNMKHVYHYRGVITPSQLPFMKSQFIETLVDCIVELHPIAVDKFMLKISEKSKFLIRVSDPKYTDGPKVWKQTTGFKDWKKFLLMPITFSYKQGIVQKVFAMKKDARFSVNFKKGIINLFNVDMTIAEAQLTSTKLLTKQEDSIIGSCPTSYVVAKYDIVSAEKKWIKIGYKITKVIDLVTCTSEDIEEFNKITPGPNELPLKNPLKSSATIKYKILGTPSAFKIEEVHAAGIHSLYPTSKEEGSIDSVTDQHLVLVEILPERLSKEEISRTEKYSIPQSLTMNIKSFGNLEQIPVPTSADMLNLVNFVYAKLTKLITVLPKLEKPDTEALKVSMPEVSLDVLEIVHVLRTADKPSLEKIWVKCETDVLKKSWVVNLIGLCHTQECVLFMKDKLTTLPEDLIADFLVSIGFNGNPTLPMITMLKDVIAMDKIKVSPKLTKIAYISATNIIKTYCKQTKLCSGIWIKTVLIDVLKTCAKPSIVCKPIGHLPAVVVLSIVENLELPELLPVLKDIILNERLPLEIRVKAVLAVRPLVRIIPEKVRVLMLRVLLDLTQDSELRTLCLAVIMDKPTHHIILHIGQWLKKEPSDLVVRFAYDKLVAMKFTPEMYLPRTVAAVHLAIKLVPFWRIPSRLRVMSQCHHIRFYSKKWHVAVTWKHEAIFKKNLIPNVIHSKLNLEIMGRKISIIEAQLRMQGVEDYLSKLLGPNGLMQYADSFIHLLRGPGKFNKAAKKLDMLKRMLPTYTVPTELPKIFSQLKMFNKLVHVKETTLDPKLDVSKLLEGDYMPHLVKLATDLEKGMIYKYSKPLMPVEVIYRMPSLIGIPMTFNLTSIVIPVSVTKLTVNTKPGLFSLKTLISKRIDSMVIKAEQKLCAIATIHGTVNFHMPNMEIGGYMQIMMNVSTSLKAAISYATKTKAFKTDIDVPKTVKEILTIKKKAFHYLKAAENAIPMSTVSKLDIKKTIEERFIEESTKVPTAPVHPVTKPESTQIPKVSEHVMWKVPFELDQMKNVEILGMKRGINHFQEQWSLKVQGKFISLSAGKVVLSDTPTVFDVIFVGYNRRIARFFLPGQGYLTIPLDSPCLTAVKTEQEVGQYFVITMVEPKIVNIRALAYLKPTYVPKLWGIASRLELIEMDKVEQIFHEALVPIQKQYLDVEEKVEPTHQKARLTHLTIVRNLLCVSPAINKLVSVEVLRISKVKHAMRRISFQHGFCYTSILGFKTCLHGIRPHPRPLILPLLFAFNEYRLIVSPPVGSTDPKIHLKISMPDPKAIVLNTAATISMKGVTPERKIILNLIYKKITKDLLITVVPSDVEIANFSKLCLKMDWKLDDLKIKVSFDKTCEYPNAEVVIKTSSKLPRSYMVFTIKHDIKSVPKYIRHVLEYLASYYIVPVLQKNFIVSPAVHPRDAYKQKVVIRLFLIRNDTIKIAVKTKYNFYVLEEMKLPTVLETLPKGSVEIPLLEKLPISLMKPHCLHRFDSFVTFDKKPITFALRPKCEHHLLRLCDKLKTDLAVTTTMVAQTVKRILTVVVESNTIEVIPRTEMHMKPIIKLNGAVLVIKTKRIIVDPKTNKPLITIIWEPIIKCITVIHHKYDLIVKLTKAHRISLRISPLFANKTCGLCGNFDGEMFNDLITPEGKLVNDVRMPTRHYSNVIPYAEKIFAASWITPCLKTACPFERRSVKVAYHMKECLTNYPVIQCAPGCKEISQPELVKIPAMCVPKASFKRFRHWPKRARVPKLDDAYELLATISIPRKCACKA